MFFPHFMLNPFYTQKRPNNTLGHLLILLRYLSNSYSKIQATGRLMAITFPYTLKSTISLSAPIISPHSIILINSESYLIARFDGLAPLSLSILEPHYNLQCVMDLFLGTDIASSFPHY